MKNLTKQFATLLLVLGLVAVAQVAGAVEAKAPKFSGGIVFQNPSFIGLKSTGTYGAASTTAKQLVDGDSGLLYAVCSFGGTAGKYSLAFDTDMTTTGEISVNSQATLITPMVLTYNNTTVAGGAGAPCWVPPYPVRFERGLVGIQDDTAHYTLYFYRLDDGSNP